MATAGIRSRWLAASMLMGLGCAAPDREPEQAPRLVSEFGQGLTLAGAVRSSPDDHLVELLRYRDHVYAANSMAGIVVARLEPDGGVTLTHVGEYSEGIRCTCLALHEASETLYCAAADLGTLTRFDVSTPGELVELDTTQLGFGGVRDLDVRADNLLFHAFDEGLWIAGLDPASGELSSIGAAPVTGNARSSVNLDERVVALLADAEGPGAVVSLLDPETWQELDRLELEGPAIGLGGDEQGGDRVAVALGSMGVAVVEVRGDRLELREQLQPPAVIDHATLSGEQLFALSVSGVFAYDLEQGGRLFGFAAEGSPGAKRSGGMLHGFVHEGELIVTDWTWIERWTIDPEGEAAGLDIPRGVYLRPGDRARWRMRNPGAVDLRAEFWRGDELAFEVLVLAGSVVEYELDPAAFELEQGPASFVVRIFDVAVDPQGEPLSRNSFRLLARRPDDVAPAPGDSFPVLTLADADMEVFELPVSEPTRLVWYSLDCALMWPEIEDLGWLHRHERHDMLDGTPMFVADTSIEWGFGRRWLIEDAPVGLFGPQAPAEVNEANSPLYGEDLLRAFVVTGLPGDAMTSDYELDAAGRVESLERSYRGPWTLRAEPR